MEIGSNILIMDDLVGEKNVELPVRPGRLEVVVFSLAEEAIKHYKKAIEIINGH